MSLGKPGHGDHWIAALGQDDPRIQDAIAFPADAPEGLKLHRRDLTQALDMVQVTARRRLVTAYPEPRATTLLRLRPRELLLWETRVEAWLVAEHEGAGALTFFLTDLVDNAERYQKARGAIELEVGALAYNVERAPAIMGPPRMRPGRERDARFLPDDYWFDGEIVRARGAGSEEVLELALQNGLVLPIASRLPTRLAPGERAQGFLWLTARWPEAEASYTA